MILKHTRFNHDEHSTQGLLQINGDFACYVLEDEERCIKVHGQTRIPEGIYQIKFREELTELTKSYRERYSWFAWHLMLQDVPNFKWIYIHVGNWDKDTEGCLLVGDVAENDPGNNSSMIGKSRQAYKRIYNLIADTLRSGEEVWIKIENI